jgi:hypothetical protein
MKSIEEEFPFMQYFPISYEKSYIINELLILSKIFKNCGKGCLINKDKIYFYKTYIPNMENMINKTKRKILLLFYCESSYKQKYIDEFTNNIFDLLEKDVFENNKLKKNITKTINDLFDIYKNIKNKDEIYGEYVSNIMKNSMEELNDRDNALIKSDSLNTRRRIDSRFIRNRESSLMSIKADYKPPLSDNNEMIKISEYDSDLTLIFKGDKYNYFYNKMKVIRKIKLINIGIFIAFALFLIPIYIIVIKYFGN